MSRARPSDRPLKVDVLMDTIEVGGIEVFIENLLSRLDRSRFSPRVVVLRATGPMQPRYEAAGIPVVHLGWRARELKSLWKLTRWMRRERTDIAVTVTDQVGALLIGRVAAHAARAVDIVTTHKMGNQRTIPRYTMESLWLADAFVMLAPTQRDHLIATEGLRRFPWRRTRDVIVPYGAELGTAPGAPERARARELMAIDDDSLVVGMVAAMRPDKAFDVLIDAVDSLRARHPSLRLVLVGSGETEEALRAQVIRLGMQDHVSFLGRRADVPDLLPGFDVMCLASYPVFETFPMAVVEALAAGRPVVATQCGALQDIITPGVEGDLVPIGDVDALAASLDGLLSDPERRAAAGAAARARAEREFDVKRMVDDYERLFEQLAGRGRGA